MKNLSHILSERREATMSLLKAKKIVWQVLILSGLLLSNSLVFGQVSPPCKFGNSVEFHQIGDSVKVPSVALNNMPQGTVEAWVKFDNLNSASPHFGEMFIVSRAKAPGGDFRLEKARTTVPEANKFVFSLDNGNTNLYSTTVAQVKTWYHVACTWDGVEWQIYVNGILENSLPDTRTLPNNNSLSVLVGAYNYSVAATAVSFDGTIDEIRISNIVRTPSDFCLTGECGSDDNTVALWHFNETTGAAASDATGHGYDGMIHGATHVNCTASTAACSNFDTPANLAADWITVQGSHSVVSTPTPHQGTGALRTQEPGGSNPYSLLKHRDLQASGGEYNFWFYQSNTVGGAVFMQSDPGGGNPSTGAARCYRMGFTANDGFAGGTMDFGRINSDGTSTQLWGYHAPPFVMNQWVNFFVRFGEGGVIQVGFIQGNTSFSQSFVDPDPITQPGEFYLLSDRTNYFDDVCFNPVAVEPANYSEAEFGGSHCFNGVDDYITVANSPSLDLGSTYTIEAWIKMRNLPYLDDYTIVSKWAGSESGGYLFAITGGFSPRGRLMLYAGFSVYATSAMTLTPEVWHHVAVTYDGQAIRFIVDGTSEEAVDAPGGTATNSVPLTIGINANHFTDPSEDPNYFRGQIDEVLISNRVKLPSEFCLTAPCIPDLHGSTAALWHFDEADISDASGRNNSGTVVGSGCEGCPGSPVLTAEATCNNITLYWDEVANADQYQIIRNDIRIVSLPSGTTTYIDNTVIQGSPNYQVRALRAGCSDGTSELVHIGLLEIPAPPSQIETTPRLAAIEVEWQAVQKATSYELYEDDQLIGRTIDTKYLSSVSRGTHCYQVKSVNDCGKSELSSPVCDEARFEVSCCGTVYADRNGNEVHDVGEEIAGASVFVLDPEFGFFPLHATSSDPSGRFCLTVPYHRLGQLWAYAGDYSSEKEAMFFTRDETDHKLATFRFGPCLHLSAADQCLQSTATLVPVLSAVPTGMGLMNKMCEIRDCFEKGDYLGMANHIREMRELSASFVLKLAAAIPGLGFLQLAEIKKYANASVDCQTTLLEEQCPLLDVICLAANGGACDYDHPYFMVSKRSPVTLQIVGQNGDTISDEVEATSGANPGSVGGFLVSTDRIHSLGMAMDSLQSYTIVATGDETSSAGTTCGMSLVLYPGTGRAFSLIFEGIPVVPGTRASITIGDRGSRVSAASLDYDGDGTPESVVLPSASSDSNTIQIKCFVQGNLSTAGIAANVYDAADNLVASLVTDQNGRCETSKLMIGEYRVVLESPLGYTCNEPIKTVVLITDSATVNFELTKLNITPQQRSRDYWAGQLTKVLQNKRADFTKAQFSRFAGLISQHFNDNLLNSVATYVVPQPANQNDSLIMMKKLLTFGCTEVNEPFLKKVAKGELVALMLNVAAGKVSQTHIVSHDGVTLSQAITYCDMLINEADCPIGTVPSWFMPGYPNRLEIMRYLKAAFVAGLINIGVTLPSGQIPLDIMDIAYKEFATQPIPTAFELSQNHPNPFNPITTIRFAIPQAGNVQLEVLNVIGQRVRTLVDETKPAGTHEVQWDGRDSNGNAVSSGVYLYRIKVGEFTATKKMVLMK